MHFQIWQDKAGNATPLTDVDPITGASVTFTDLTSNQPDTLQANRLMPAPCDFISQTLPACSIIRPIQTAQGGAVATIQSFIKEGLFIGQPDAFTQMLLDMATAADQAGR
jgi:hypothetical protein